MDRDRRRTRLRFRPDNETLEARVVLNGGTTPAGSVSVLSTPAAGMNTYQTRLQRIDRLPFFLNTSSPGRPLPPQIMSSIQEDLRSVIGQLRPATRNGLFTFNRQVRGILAGSSVSEQDLRQLSKLTEDILAATVMSRVTAVSLRNGLEDLTRVTVAGVPNPPSTVANDYSLILQLALAMGKPLPAPRPATLATNIQIPGQPYATRNRQPTLVGTYEPGMTVMLFNKERTRVLATANTDANGFYKLKSRIALQPGRYDLRLRAISSDGVTSQWSQPVSFVVVA
jgi:hypothetical protein